MKNVLRDLVRRWGWRSLLGCLFYGAMVWFGVPDLSHWTAGFFPLALFLGVTQLSTELSRGDVPRVLRTLPVTAKEVGRAWWWVCVGLPALTLGVITAAVYGVAAFINHHSFIGVITPWNIPVHLRHDPLSGMGCFCFWLTNALWFGPLFLLYSGTTAPGQRFWVTLRGLCFSLLFGAAFFTMMLFYLLFPPYTIRWEIFVLVGTLLTLASWFRAEALAQERLGGLPTVTGRQQAEALSGQMTDRAMEIIGRPFTGGRAAGARCAEGPGGRRFLFQMIFYPMFGQGLAMVLVCGLLMYLPLTAEDSDVFAGAFWTLASPFLWLAGLLVLPRALLSIRWLRTLPVSAAQLAGVLIGAPLAAMLAFMGLGNVILGLVYPLSQLSLSAMLHQGCLPQMALTTVLVPLLLWRGQDALVMTLVLLLLMGGALSSVYIRQHIPLPENLGAALLLVLGNYGLTQRLLARNSRVYRPRGGAGGGLTWFGNVEG